ncbi:hypothetical protein [Vibrio alginolyticus]|uniref:hypothetical protein n=1 Tax=Vibrio alginolyticus TaxID=663 RepID=UPI003F6762C3
MGSAIGGIYTPILSLLTIVLISRQVQLQKEMNNHTKDEWCLENEKNKARESIGVLEKLLMEDKGGNRLKDQLYEIAEKQRKDALSFFWHSNTELFAKFITLYAVLDSLSESENVYYIVAY